MGGDWARIGAEKKKQGKEEEGRRVLQRGVEKRRPLPPLASARRRRTEERYELGGKCGTGGRKRWIWRRAGKSGGAGVLGTGVGVDVDVVAGLTVERNAAELHLPHVIPKRNFAREAAATETNKKIRASPWSAPLVFSESRESVESRRSQVVVERGAKPTPAAQDRDVHGCVLVASTVYSDPRVLGTEQFWCLRAAEACRAKSRTSFSGRSRATTLAQRCLEPCPLWRGPEQDLLTARRGGISDGCVDARWDEAPSVVISQTVSSSVMTCSSFLTPHAPPIQLVCARAAKASPSPPRSLCSAAISVKGWQTHPRSKTEKPPPRSAVQTHWRPQRELANVLLDDRRRERGRGRGVEVCDAFDSPDTTHAKCSQHNRISHHIRARAASPHRRDTLSTRLPVILSVRFQEQ